MAGGGGGVQIGDIKISGSGQWYKWVDGEKEIHVAFQDDKVVGKAKKGF